MVFLVTFICVCVSRRSSILLLHGSSSRRRRRFPMYVGMYVDPCTFCTLRVFIAAKEEALACPEGVIYVLADDFTISRPYKPGIRSCGVFLVRGHVLQYVPMMARHWSGPRFTTASRCFRPVQIARVVDTGIEVQVYNISSIYFSTRFPTNYWSMHLHW